jgi:hypothetical protein
MGKESEKLFKEYFEKRFNLTLNHLCNRPGFERGADFELSTTGTLLEVKTDSKQESPNLLIEKYGNKETKTPGGILKALGDGCELYAAYFPNESRPGQHKLFLYPADKFCFRFLTAIEEGVARMFCGHSSSGGSTWLNECYIIPKQYFSDLQITSKEELNLYLQKKSA